MKLFTFSITFATLLCLVHGQPVENNAKLRKLKLQTQPYSLPLAKRSDTSYEKVEQTGYFHGSGYYSEVYVGEPPQRFDVVLDTGSSDFWLMSEACSTKKHCQGHHQFNPKVSKTYKRLEDVGIQIRYGTGSIIAGVGHDTIRIGSMKLENQFVSDATTVSAEFENLPIDGIMGLGLNKLSKTKGKKYSFVENMVKQNLIDKAVFGIYTQPAGGEIDFGGTDPSRYNGSIVYAPVTNYNYWQTNLDGYTFGKHTSREARELILDTGTTLLIVTPEDAESIHAQIKGSRANKDGTYAIPCDVKGKAPPLKIKVNGHLLSISSEDYILVASGKDPSMCMSGISGQDVHRPNHWILGSVFLKSHYTVFDYDKMRIGFAKSVTDPTLSVETYDNSNV